MASLSSQMNQASDQQLDTQAIDQEASQDDQEQFLAYQEQDSPSIEEGGDELQRYARELFGSEREGIERDYEQEAVNFINGIVEDQENRADLRYGEGKYDKFNAWFDREGRRVENAQDLETLGEYKENGEWKKWAKIGLKVAGGFGLAAAMTFTGLGVVPIVTPVLWTIGMRNGFDGVIEAAEKLHWGPERTKKELEAQRALSEEITKLKGWLKRRKAEGRGLIDNEYDVFAGSIIEAADKVSQVEEENLASEHKWAVGRAVASSVLTLGTAVFAGIPLGIRNYDQIAPGHHIFWNHHGMQFLYNDPSKLAETARLAQVHQMNFSYYHDIFGRAAHSLGRGLSLVNFSGLAASFLYLTSKYLIAQEKKDLKYFRIPYHYNPEAQPMVRVRLRGGRVRRVEAPAIVTKEATLGDKKELSRKMAMITLARIRSYLELNAPTAAESDVIFNQKTKELVQDIVIHGMGRPLSPHSDTDGEGCKFMLARAGFDTSQIEYVEQGQFKTGQPNWDTGNRHGLVVEGIDAEHPFGQTFFFDHHGDETGDDLSSSEVTYETLAASGFLEKTEALDKFVKFITYIDNANHPKLAETFAYSHRTVLGFYRDMSAEELYRFFEQGGDETKELSDDEIRAIHPRLLEKSKNTRRENLTASELIRRGETEGMAIETPYGKALIDIGGRIRRAEAVFAHGYKIHIRWQPERSQFFISGWPRDKALTQGKRIRGMWLKPLEDRGPVRVRLSDVIFALTDGNLTPQGRLKEYLENEAQGRVIGRIGRTQRSERGDQRRGIRSDRRSAQAA